MLFRSVKDEMRNLKCIYLSGKRFIVRRSKRCRVGKYKSEKPFIAFKWWWLCVKDRDKWWNKVLREKYGIKLCSDLIQVKFDGSSSGILHSIQKIGMLEKPNGLMLNQLKLKVNNGKYVHFWDNTWVGSSHLEILSQGFSNCR